MGIAIIQIHGREKLRVILVLDIRKKRYNGKIQGLNGTATGEVEKEVKARSVLKNLVRLVNLDDRQPAEPFTIFQPSFSIGSNENDYIPCVKPGKFPEQVQTIVQYSSTARCGEGQEIETYSQTPAQNHALIDLIYWTSAI